MNHFKAWKHRETDNCKTEKPLSLFKKMKTECSVKEDETKADNYLDLKNLDRSNIISKFLYNVLK